MGLFSIRLRATKGLSVSFQVKANLPLATHDGVMLLAQGFCVPYALSLNLMIILCH